MEKISIGLIALYDARRCGGPDDSRRIGAPRE
jgi:hypothetical protein